MQFVTFMQSTEQLGVFQCYLHILHDGIHAKYVNGMGKFADIGAVHDMSGWLPASQHLVIVMRRTYGFQLPLAVTSAKHKQFSMIIFIFCSTCHVTKYSRGVGFSVPSFWWWLNTFM